MVHIQPDTFDLIVVGSGLPECLIGGAVARAGQSVLVIEPEDSYGSEFSSCTLEALEQQLQAPPEPPASQSPDPAAIGHAKALLLPRFRLPIDGLQRWSWPGADIGNQSTYIFDLAPKAVYQAETLVDVLVRTRAHNYVEFKLIEGSYIWRDGQLQAVPASRSAIFKDRSLSLSDKRLLMRFISSAVEAVEGGTGALKGMLLSDWPLAVVLKDAGLPPPLRDVILYGIAMCDHNQQPPAATCPTGTGRATAAANAIGSEAMATDGTNGAAGGCGSSIGVPAVSSAAEGCAALKLLLDSLGRFGAPGAFMVPSFGCGSIPEAFVRFAAVHGATTVLRQPISALLLDSNNGQSLSGNTGVDGTDNNDSGREITAPLCRGVVTASGQMLKCTKLLANSNVLRPLLQEHPAITDSSSSGSSGNAGVNRVLSRAIVIMDSPLVHGNNMLCLVVPPLAINGANRHAIRGLQMGPAANVAPPTRYLLYLSTPAGSTGGAAEDLQAAVAALVDASGLQHCPRGLPAPMQVPATSAGSIHAPSNPPAAHEHGGSSNRDAGAAASRQASPAPASGRPRALRAYYYRQRYGNTSTDPASSSTAASSTLSSVPPHQQQRLPPNVACCASGDPSLLGYAKVLRDAAAVMARHWPSLAWLADIGTAAARGDEDDSDEDTVEDLRAALESLAATAQSAPGDDEGAASNPLDMAPGTGSMAPNTISGSASGAVPGTAVQPSSRWDVAARPGSIAEGTLPSSGAAAPCSTSPAASQQETAAGTGQL